MSSFIDPKDRDYQRFQHRGSDGKMRYSTGRGDAIQKAFIVAGADLSVLKEVASANDVDIAKYKGLNPGQVRMNLGTILRARVRKGTPVKIGKIKVESLTQKIDLPEVVLKARVAPPKRAAKANGGSKPRKAKAPVKAKGKRAGRTASTAKRKGA